MVSSRVMDVGDIASAAAVVVALLALGVSWAARKDARRSADASEESARQARRSADADERAVALAQHEAEQQASKRHDDSGPEFVRVAGDILDRTARVELRIVGGPGRVVLHVRAAAPWCSGVAAGDEGAGESVTFPPMHPGETFTVTAHLRTSPRGHGKVVLPLVIDVESREDRWRTWQRLVEVELNEGPMVAWV
jgi:hypothetical protein